ncbi:MAG: serine/threonine protein kinase [Mycobacterium sp.]|nr:MAG: serine/threonine protein kinase [Mycobacterium sp.]
MGEVWRAHDSEIDRMVAIKTLLPNFAEDEKFEQRFRREARLAARLDDPHVVPIYDVGEIDGRLYVSMRLIVGQDLQTLLEAGPMDPRRAVAIVGQVAGALNAAHAVGLVHRDVKPSNILVADNDFAYLIDFGIARATGETGLTSTGTTIGTWSYMAPERFATGIAGAPSDIYALACVLFQCLTGELPFPAVALEQIAVAHMTAPPPKPCGTRPDIPIAMNTVIATGLAKRPEDRYASTVQLAEAARDALGTHTDPIAPPQLPSTVVAAKSTEQTPKVQHQSTPPENAVSGLPASADAATRPASPIGSHDSGVVKNASGTRGRPFWRRKSVVLPMALCVAVAIAAAVLLFRENPRGDLSYGQQVVVFGDAARSSHGVAVDNAGSVYVTAEDSGGNRTNVLKLAPGANRPEQLPFPNLNYLDGVAVDNAGAVYVIARDNGTNKVLKLPAGASRPDVLPFPPDLKRTAGPAVDASGAVYVSENVPDSTPQVLKLPAGASHAEKLPFTNLKVTLGIAVDDAGAVYITDASDSSVGRVLKLPAGAPRPEVLPFIHLRSPEGVAVGSGGAVYVADDDVEHPRVLKLAAGADHSDVLPFNRIQDPKGVATDKSGAVYVSEGAAAVVVKLPVK